MNVESSRNHSDHAFRNELWGMNYGYSPFGHLSADGTTICIHIVAIIVEYKLIFILVFSKLPLPLETRDCTVGRLLVFAIIVEYKLIFILVLSKLLLETRD